MAAITTMSSQSIKHKFDTILDSILNLELKLSTFNSKGVHYYLL